MTERIEALRVTISGWVQGVSFRVSMKAVAQESHLVGWVRNLNDGSVEALIQGSKENVERVLEWCRTGPPRAKVIELRVIRVEVDPMIRSFGVLI